MNNNKNISKDSEKHKTSNKTEIHSSTEAKLNASANQTQIDENQNQIAESEVHYDFSVRILYSIKKQNHFRPTILYKKQHAWS